MVEIVNFEKRVDGDLVPQVSLTAPFNFSFSC